MRPSELAEDLSGGFTASAVESPAPLGEEGEAASSPELAESPSKSGHVLEVSPTTAPQPGPALEEKEDVPLISPDTSLENQPDASEAPELQSEQDVNRNLMPSVVFMSSVVSLSIVLQDPSALFFIGLLMVLNRF